MGCKIPQWVGFFFFNISLICAHLKVLTIRLTVVFLNYSNILMFFDQWQFGAF